MRIALGCAAFLALLAAPATIAQTLTLDEAIELALASEPTVAIASADRDIAEAARREARSALDPQISISGSAFRHDEPMVVSPIHGFSPGLIPEFDETLIQSALSGTWLLWDGGGARARVRQAESLAGSAEEAIAQARQALIARTTAAYLSVISGRETVAAEDLRLRALEAELGRIELLKQVGRAANLEIFRAEAAKAAAESDLTAAAALLDVAEAELSRLTSLPRERTREGNLSRSFIVSPHSADTSSLEAAALEANPRARQARQRLAAQSAAVDAARAGLRPQVNVAGNVLEYGSANGDFTFEWNAGVNLRFSLFDSGANSARIERAMAGERLARAQLAAVENDVRHSLDRAWADLRQAQASLESLARAEQRLAEVARIEKLRLDNGAGTQNDYLRAEADLVSARAALARSRQRLALANIDLARAAGRLEPSWIAANLRSSE
jgi:outer membrane protein TolC